MPCAIWATTALECGHLAHEDCEGKDCKLYCAPPKRFWLLEWAAYVVFGAFGAADAFMGRKRRSVMVASTFGILWAIDVVLSPLRWLTGWDLTDFLYVALVVTRFSALLGVPKEAAAAAAMWVSGRYGFEWGRGSLLDAATSIPLAAAFVWVFRQYDVLGSAAVAGYAFWYVWRKPTVHDVHCGNCCGLWTMAMVSLVVSSFTAFVVGSAAFKTFEGATVLHAWFVCTRLFPRQTKDPFDKFSAELIRAVCHVAGVVFFVRGVTLDLQTHRATFVHN